MVDHAAIEALVRSAGQMILQAKITDDAVHEKEGQANYCTDYDVAIQRCLIDGLKKILPGAGFFGEEDMAENQARDSEYVFYIDPIDGTTNFMFGYHHSCVSVGLGHRGKMIAGYVYNPYVDEMYKGIRGEGSFLNGRRLQMADLPLVKGIAAFGCARYNDGGVDRMFAAVKELFLRSLSIRNGGSAALDLCRIASGNNVAYVELKLQPYDYAAASVIVEEAGGVISQEDGQPITLDRPCSIVGGTPRAWAEVREILGRQDA